MEANMTELTAIVSTLQMEIKLLQGNVTTLATASDLSSMSVDMDTMWLMIGAVLVVFMQAGFCMLEVGSIGAKNTKNLLTKNILDLAISAVMWWMCGYGIAFGNRKEGSTVNKIIGTESFFVNGDVFNDEQGFNSTEQGYQYARWLFQWSFSGTAITIVSGAVGERVTIASYLSLAVIMVSFVYPLIVRWGWNPEGWASAWSSDRDDLLLGCGVLDFAGSGVIHTTGGSAAVVMITLLGPRLGRFADNGDVAKMEKQSVVLQALGTFILWMGWYAFNGSSTLYITGKAHVAAKAMVCTTLAAAGAGLGVASASMILFQQVNPEQINNGVLSGLVAITAGCAVVEVEGAFIIGAIAGVIYLGGSNFLERVRIDDMVDASPVHLANGVWGMVAAGLFASKEGYAASYYAERADRCCGWLYGCGPAQLGANVVFTLVVITWTVINAVILGTFFQAIGLLRISAHAEKMGTDSVAHGGMEIPDFVQSILKRIEAVAETAGCNETCSSSLSHGKS